MEYYKNKNGYIECIVKPNIYLSEVTSVDYSTIPEIFLPTHILDEIKKYDRNDSEERPGIFKIYKASRRLNVEDILREKRRYSNIIVDEESIKKGLEKGLDVKVIFDDSEAFNAYMPMWIGASQLRLMGTLKINLSFPLVYRPKLSNILSLYSLEDSLQYL